MNEIWKDIPSFNGRYQVSNYGRIKSMPKLVNGRNTQYYTKERFLDGLINETGHLYIEIKKDAKLKSKKVFIHRAVMYAFKKISDKVVHHKDENPKNNHLSNLCYLTIQEHRKEHTNEDSYIYYHKTTNKYITRFQVGDKTFSKSVDTKEEALKIKKHIEANGLDSIRDFDKKPKCVSYYKQTNRYVLKIKNKHIGYFKTEEEAIKTRDDLLNST